MAVDYVLEDLMGKLGKSLIYIHIYAWYMTATIDYKMFCLSGQRANNIPAADCQRKVYSLIISKRKQPVFYVSSSLSSVVINSLLKVLS